MISLQPPSRGEIGSLSQASSQPANHPSRLDIGVFSTASIHGEDWWSLSSFKPRWSLSSLQAGGRLAASSPAVIQREDSWFLLSGHPEEYL